MTTLTTQPRQAIYDLSEFLLKMRDVSQQFWNSLLNWIRQIVQRIAQVCGVKAGGVPGLEGDEIVKSRFRDDIMPDLPANLRENDADFIGPDVIDADPVVTMAYRPDLVLPLLFSNPLPQRALPAPAALRTVTFSGETQEAADTARDLFAADMVAIASQPWAFGEEPTDRVGVLRMLSLAVERAEICRLAHLIAMEHAQQMGDDVRKQNLVDADPTLSQVFRDVGSAQQSEDDRDSAHGQLRLLFETTRRIEEQYRCCIGVANMLTAALPGPADQAELKAEVDAATCRAAENFGRPEALVTHPFCSPLPKVTDLLALYQHPPAEVPSDEDDDELHEIVHGEMRL